MSKFISCNTIRRSINKTFLLFGLLAFSLVSRSQSYEDSTAIIEEAIVDTTYVDGEEDEETSDKTDHFLERSEGDSLFISERQLPPGHTRKMKDDNDFWYADTEVKKEEKKQETTTASEYVPIGQRSWFQTLLWLVIIGTFAGAIMWYLADNNIGLFRKKNITTAADTITDEIPEDIFAINYQREIDKAAAQGNYRLAVRLMYLRLLKNLADRNIIQYKQDKTNFDYLLQLSSTKHYNSFFRLTRHYEYSWYGHFDVEENAYRIINREFDQFDREIR